MQYPKPHHGSTSEFQVSGFPFVTSSIADEVGTSAAIKVKFPYVTQFIQVTNIGGNPLLVGFSENGVKGAVTANRFLVGKDAGDQVSPVLPIKCKELFFLGSGGDTGFSVVAGLTNVLEFPILTGSNGFEGVG